MTVKLRRNLRLLKTENVLTSVLLAMPVMNLFFAEEIGMTLPEVGLSQALCGIAILALNIPTGWLADRFSRKACNIGGDSIITVSLIFYAFAHTFSDVVFAEILFGIGAAFTGGADTGLLRAYCKELGESFVKTNAQLQSYRLIAGVIAMAIGGAIGAHNLRLAVGLSAVTYAVGAILSLFIEEIGERRINQTGPLRDMAQITMHALHENKRLAWSIAAYALGNESTHAMIWLLTPLLVIADVPTQIIGIVWSLNIAVAWCGTRLAKRFADDLMEWRQLLIGLSVFCVASVVLLIDVNLVTIAFYAGYGFVRGWFSSTLMPIVQNHASDDIQSTVSSIAGSVSKVFYIPLVWVIVALGETDPRLSVAGSLIVFVPLLLVATFNIRRLERG
ncbi:MFS transporter [Candidatus Saccharibacteria bacterium]|nr:MFS transporter [Candidatus Saccharibacteria bacterium]